jgi:hypothetical protein
MDPVTLFWMLIFAWIVTLVFGIVAYIIILRRFAVRYRRAMIEFSKNAVLALILGTAFFAASSVNNVISGDIIASTIGVLQIVLIVFFILIIGAAVFIPIYNLGERERDN